MAQRFRYIQREYPIFKEESMKVLVIIVSYNFERWIDRCLGSLRSSVHPVDTVVIDNASHDQTLQRIKQDYPEIHLIESKTNLGFANVGLPIEFWLSADENNAPQSAHSLSLSASTSLFGGRYRLAGDSRCSRTLVRSIVSYRL